MSKGSRVLAWRSAAPLLAAHAKHILFRDLSLRRTFSSSFCSNCPADQMYELLAERADEVLEQLTPQGLANLAWGLTVAAWYPPQVRTRVTTVVFELTQSAIPLLSVGHGVLSALAARTVAACCPPG